MSEEQSQESRVKSLIVGGIHQSIAHHTTARGARTLFHDMFVKFVVVACMLKIVMDGTNIPEEWIKNAIGCGHRQIKNPVT